jgi:hypothetical protein
MKASESFDDDYFGLANDLYRLRQDVEGDDAEYCRDERHGMAARN